MFFDVCMSGVGMAPEITNDDQVCLDHSWQRQNWMQWLHCTETELRLAVETVGADPDNVRRFLRQMR